MNKQLSEYGGTLALSTSAVITSVRSLVNTSFIGLNQGRLPIISYHYGAKNYDKVKEALILSIRLVLVLAVIFVSFVMFNTEFIVRIFLNEPPEVIAQIAAYVRLNLSMMVFTSLFLNFTNYFQAIGRPTLPNIFVVIRLIICNLSLLIILPKLYGVRGIFMAFPISDTITFSIAGIFILRELRRLNNLEKGFCTV